VLTFLAGAIFFMDEARLAVESGATLVLLADEAGELRPGAAVWVAGVHSGNVTGIRFLGDGGRATPNLEIRIVLDREAARELRSDARATIKPSGLLAPLVIDLDPGSPGASPFDRGDTLRAELSITTRALEAFGDSLRRIAEDLGPVAERIRRDLAIPQGTLASLSRAAETFAQLRADLAALEGMEARSGSLGRLLSDTAVASGLRRSSDRLDTLAAAAARRDGRERATAELHALGERLERLGLELDAARGTVGRALHDREIQNQARLFRARADSVRADLARAPFRWLRLRLF
jgi:ABC-type transporter Mla subunit MlaD